MPDPLTILHGNCLEVLATLPDESVHCCVTSPPFLWLRDYGLEPTAWPAVTYRPMTGLQEVTVPAQAAVLDPFGGAGTTGLEALQLGRQAVLIEAKAEYVLQARERSRGVQPQLPGATP